jgi:hypothetical protein
MNLSAADDIPVPRRRPGPRSAQALLRIALVPGLRRGTTILPLLLLTACTSVQLPAGPAPLDPIAFFTGETRGIGTLDPIVGRSVPISVESRGTPEAGGLRLVQRIREGTKPGRVRTWTMRKVAPGRYTGTLTDASGPVELTVSGARAYVRYRTPSGLTIGQQLALQPDGRTILNHLEAHRFGIRLAVLDETIRKPVAK